MDRSTPQIRLHIVNGDILDQQDVGAVVNSWNRNFIPYWLLTPHGVSGALKKVTGPEPWRELTRKGLLKPGEAVITTGGKLGKPIIHVAALNALWVSTDQTISDGAKNAVKLAYEQGFKSVAMPILGSGVGGKPQKEALTIIQDSIRDWISIHPFGENVMEVRLIVFPQRSTF